MSGSRSIKKLREQLLLFRNEDYIGINKPLGFETKAGKEVPKPFRDLLEQMELVKSSCPVPINSMGSSVSGVQLMSLHASAGKQARAMMKEGQFWRCRYWGIVDGIIKGRNDRGTINVPVKDGVIHPDGEPSITHWKLLKYSTEERISLIEFEPRTEVPNQIFLHSEANLKTPIIAESGIHLVEVSACLPEALDIKAPVQNEFKLKMQTLGWL
jgi:23S rRNA-/tRNA-specific pseudouridylate synthase